MLADAIAAERFRLWRNRISLFWGFAFAPLVAMLFSMAIDMFTRVILHRTIPGETTDLANRAMGAVAGASGPITALFLLIGAAAIFAGDYRWETWRLVTPRNSRVSLLAASLIVFGEAAAWSLLATAIGAVLGDKGEPDGPNAVLADVLRAETPALIRALVEAGVEITEARWREADLESAYLGALEPKDLADAR